MNVLVIDDDIELRDILTGLLQDKGYFVYQAENGQVGIDLLGKVQIDFVISDIQMPIMNGYDFLIKARKIFGNHLQIFLVTGYSPYTSEQIYKAGANGYFEKPFELDNLLISLKKVA